LALYAGAFGPLDSIYIGGGTPSVLNLSQIGALFEAFRRHFTFAPDVETTIEANPDDVNKEWLTMVRCLGVNRISLGVQSFKDKDLTFLGRRHDARRATEAVEAARQAGFANIGLDLIYGLPNQSKGDWLATLEHAISLRPTHLSCYLLTVEGETPLKRLVREGRIKPADAEKERSLFLVTSRFLQTSGYAHYEVSNFSLSEDYACRHNEKYWRHIPYLGLGPSAHSFDGRTRWWNQGSLEEYCTRLEMEASAVEEAERLSEEQLNLERLYLGLRTAVGIPLEDLDSKTAPIIRQLQKAKILRLAHGRVRPTVKGYLVADSLPLLLA
jgi:putative oxygen-independent coproporphyrinogen III oxidase